MYKQILVFCRKKKIAELQSKKPKKTVGLPGFLCYNSGDYFSVNGGCYFAVQHLLHNAQFYLLCVCHHAGVLPVSRKEIQMDGTAGGERIFLSCGRLQVRVFNPVHLPDDLPDRIVD